MGFYERRLVRPSFVHLVEVLEEATAEANRGQRRLAVDHGSWESFVAEIRSVPEGMRQWAPPWAEGQSAGLLGAAWWTDPEGGRHFRVWACGPPVSWSGRLLFHTGEARPALWRVYPDRVYRRLREGRAKWLVACSCGACGTPTAVRWMGPCCGACHQGQRRQGADEPTLYRGQATGVQMLAFTPDGRSLAVRERGGYAFLWNLSDGSRCNFQDPTLEAAVAMGFSPDGRLLASVNLARGLSLTEWPSGTSRQLYQTPSVVHTLAFSPDGRALALAGEKELEVWQQEGPDAPWLPVYSRPAGASALAFSPDGALLAAGDSQGRLFLLDRHRWGWEQPLWPRRDDTGWQVCAVAFTPDGQDLVALWVGKEGKPTPEGIPRSHRLERWELPSARWQKGAEFELPPSARWTFAPDGRWVAGIAGCDVVVVDSLLGQHTRLAWDPGEVLSCLAFSPDGRTLATGGEHGSVKLWPWRQLLEA
jgi:hypothetical protein